MKKSPHEIVQRTRGRDTALEAFNGRGYFKMPWEGASFGESARQGDTGWHEVQAVNDDWTSDCRRLAHAKS